MVDNGHGLMGFLSLVTMDIPNCTYGKLCLANFEVISGYVKKSFFVLRSCRCKKLFFRFVSELWFNVNCELI